MKKNKTKKEDNSMVLNFKLDLDDMDSPEMILDVSSYVEKNNENIILVKNKKGKFNKYANGRDISTGLF